MYLSIAQIGGRGTFSHAFLGGVRTLARIAWGKFLLVNHQVQTGLCFFLGNGIKGPKKGLTEGGGSITILAMPK